jgi:hypothetical protein
LHPQQRLESRRRTTSQSTTALLRTDIRARSRCVHLTARVAYNNGNRAGRIRRAARRHVKRQVPCLAETNPVRLAACIPSLCLANRRLSCRTGFHTSRDEPPFRRTRAPVSTHQEPRLSALVRRVSCANPSRTAIPPNGYRITEQEPRLVEVLGELGSRPSHVRTSIPSAHIVSSKPRDGCSSRSALPPPPRKKNEKRRNATHQASPAPRPWRPRLRRLRL